MLLYETRLRNLILLAPYLLFPPSPTLHLLLNISNALPLLHSRLDFSMAPNALAEDYRVKWKNANDRIFDLETVVAELHAELQQVRQAAAGQASVATTTEQLTLANVHITDLENTVNERENTLQQARRELTEALSHIRLLEKSLSSGAGRGGQFGNAATSANPNAAMEVMNLRHQLEFAQNNENSLRQQMKELKADDAITSDNYRSRLASADGVEAALRKQITEWKSKTKKAESKAAKEEKWKETAQKRVKSLEASLTREKNNT